VAAIVKRYRQLCGELAYWCKHAGSAEQIDQLRTASQSLLQALRIYQADLGELNLRPIRYRPPEPMTHMQLVRALLSAMRVADAPLHVEHIVQAILAQIDLPHAPELTIWLQRRVGRALVGLQKRGVVRQTAPDIWSLSY
jgi:hypothetical protein